MAWRKIEREHHCPHCGELIASNNYRTQDWTVEEMERDWHQLLEFKIEKHAPICIQGLEAQFLL